MDNLTKKVRGECAVMDERIGYRSDCLLILAVGDVAEFLASACNTTRRKKTRRNTIRMRNRE
jgi:hypothetical protein